MSKSYCASCGNSLNEGDVYCNNCGASLDGIGPSSASSKVQPIQQPTQQPILATPMNQQQKSIAQTPTIQTGAVPSKKRNQMSELAFISAVVGIFVPILPGLVAIILGIIGVRKPYSKNKAIWAIILGVIEIVGYVLLYVLVLRRLGRT